MKKFAVKHRGKIEMLLEFLIKLNVIAIPMYLILFSGANFYPLQTLTTDISYTVFRTLGYSVQKDWVTLAFDSENIAADIMIDMDCTAWKSMYALAALILASPVKNDRKKLKHIGLGVAALFMLNITRIVSTVVFANTFGLQYMEIVHTVLWREGMIFAVVLIWYAWLKQQTKKQKIILNKNQTILRKLLKE